MQTAVEASKKVQLDYEDMLALFDVEEAISLGATVPHGHRNLLHTQRTRKGMLAPEACIPPETFFNELRQRGIVFELEA